MELVRETRWSRHFADETLGIKLVQSKFADGSADINLADLEREWPDWPAKEKVDFAHAVTESKSADLPEIYRFIMKHGDFETWAPIASWVVRKLPREEAVPFIVEACRTVEVGKGEKFYQALALSQDAQAVPVLQECLKRIWADRRLLMDTGFVDAAANDACVCIECLLQLGHRSPDLNDKYRALSNHPINLNRQAAINRLSLYFT